MKTMMKSVTSFTAVALVLAGCGGTSGSTTEPARAADGNTVRTASGDAVSEAAHNAWQDGLAFFNQHETSGWDSGSCDTAASKFENAAEAQNGRFPEALYMAGLSHARCNERDEALSFYNRALSVNDHYCKARVAIGVDQLAQNATDAARQTFQRAIRDDIACTEGYVNVAMLQRQSGTAAQLTEAIQNLRRALAVNSTYLPALNEMALIYYSQSDADPQRLDLASVVCRQAQLINREYAPIYNTWGLINMKKGNINEAIRLFSRAAELDRGNFEANMNLGQITLSFRGYEDAQRSFARAVELQARNYDAHIGLGMALRGLNRLDEAQREYEAARDIDATRPEAFFNLGILTYSYRGGAIEHLRRAKEYFNEFLAKAASNPRYADNVQDVRRRCEQRTGRRRRLQSAQCRPGILQNIDTAIEALAAMANMPATPAAPATPPAAPAPTR